MPTGSGSDWVTMEPLPRQLRVRLQDLEDLCSYFKQLFLLSIVNLWILESSRQLNHLEYNLAHRDQNDVLQSNSMQGDYNQDIG